MGKIKHYHMTFLKFTVCHLPIQLNLFLFFFSSFVFSFFSSSFLFFEATSIDRYLLNRDFNGYLIKKISVKETFKISEFANYLSVQFFACFKNFGKAHNLLIMNKSI